MEFSSLATEIKNYTYTKFLEDFYNEINVKYNKIIIDTWNANDTYNSGEEVEYKDKNRTSIYQSVIDGNINHLPTNTEYWQKSRTLLSSIILQSEIEKNISIIKNTPHIIHQCFNQVRGKQYLQHIIGLYVASEIWEERFNTYDNVFGVQEQDRLEDAEQKSKISDLAINNIDVLFIKNNPFALRILKEIRKLYHPEVIVSHNNGFDNLY